MELDNFKLEVYTDNSAEHRQVIAALQREDVNKVYGDLSYFIMKTKRRGQANYRDEVFIPYYNDCPIGFAALYTSNERVFTTCGLLEEFKNQNLEALLLSEFSEKLFESYNFENLSLSVDPRNAAEIAMAQLAGFEQSGVTQYVLPNINRR